jgi:hypothetical protein
MECHKTFTHILALASVLVIGSGRGLCSGPLPEVASVVIEKIAAHIAEERFWGLMPAGRAKLDLVLFVANKGYEKADFDLLAIVPQINETLEMRNCQRQPPVFVQGWGHSDSSKDRPDEYLKKELEHFPELISRANRYDTVISIASDPVALFKLQPALRNKRVEQIKSALSQLIPQRPLRIRIAYFSALSDQIEVLVPQVDEMFTMSVVHESCDKESVQVGRELALRSIRPDLKEKIEKYSTAEVIE